MSFGALAPSAHRSAEEAAEELRPLLIEGARAALRSRVPVGFQVSGGLDSTGVAAAGYAAGLAPETPAYSIVFPGLVCDEERFSRPAAQALGMRWIPVDTEGHNTLDIACIQARLGPPLGPNAFMLQALLERASSAGTGVLLDGQDGDAVLRAGPWVLDLLLRGRPVQFARALRAVGLRHLGQALRPVATWAVPQAVRALSSDDRQRPY